jgi:hypothetical protein
VGSQRATAGFHRLAVANAFFAPTVPPSALANCVGALAAARAVNTGL